MPSACSRGWLYSTCGREQQQGNVQLKSKTRITAGKRHVGAPPGVWRAPLVAALKQEDTAETANSNQQRNSRPKTQDSLPAALPQTQQQSALANAPSAAGSVGKSSHLAVAAAAFSVFGLTVADVLSPVSLHLLAPIDTAVQHWAAGIHVDRQAANLLSNTPITLALIACVVVGCSSGLQQPLQIARRFSFIAAVYFFPAWGLSAKDVPIMDLLKHFIHRSRPGYGLIKSATFSMPSGHTFAAAFFIGAALLLAGATSADGSNDALSKWVRRYATPLWALAAVTAMGRLLSDVHWLSDTLAGGALAAGMLALTALALEQIERADAQQGS